LKAVIYSIERVGTGTLSTMARPRGGDWLVDELEALRAEGVDVVVSMLTASEARELELEDEARAATAAGLQFVELPTPDRSTPGVSEFKALIELLEAQLCDEKHVVVHCRMGIGRSSLVAAGILMIEGVSAPNAWAAIAKARGLAVPDTLVQKDWLDAVLTSW
jgi:protein-tyrosine phosphatase